MPFYWCNAYVSDHQLVERSKNRGLLLSKDCLYTLQKIEAKLTATSFCFYTFKQYNENKFLGNDRKTDWHTFPGSSPWLYIWLKSLQVRLYLPVQVFWASHSFSGPVALPTFDCVNACSISSSKNFGTWKLPSNKIGILVLLGSYPPQRSKMSLVSMMKLPDSSISRIF